MGPPPRQGVQVEWHGGHQGLPLAGGHLRYLAPVQPDPTDELDVVGDHVPGQLLSGDDDLLAHEAPTGVLHHREGLREDLLEGVLDGLQVLLLEGGDLHGEVLALEGVLGVALLLTQLRDLLHELASGLRDAILELLGFGPELVVGQGGESLVYLVDLFDEGLQLLRLPLVAGAEKGFDGGFQHET